MRFTSVFGLITTIFLIHDVKAQGILDFITSALNLGTEAPSDPCSEDSTEMFAEAISDFTNILIGQAVDNDQYHFVISPYSMWMSLAAIAEGATGRVKAELYDILGLPTEACMREKFYSTAVDLEDSGDDVQFTGKRVLLLDENSSVDRRWAKVVHDTGLLDWKYVHLHRESSEETETFLTSLDIEGNSILLDSINVEAKWTTAFSSTRKLSDFYDETGTVIGQVELMTMTKQVRLAHLPSLDAKILELPVGDEGRFTMLIALGSTTIPIKQLMTLFQSSLIGQVLSALTLNLLPIDIAIPEIVMKSNFEAKAMLEDLGVKSLWYDPPGTRLISNPSALPDNLFHRVSVYLDAAGVNPAPADEADDIVTGLLRTVSSLTAKTASLIGRDFIANKPFTYCLLDTKTKAIIFAGVFADPN